MTWEKTSYSNYRLVNSDGRIQGEIRCNHSDNSWTATHNDKFLGRYVSEQQAKNAVEVEELSGRTT